MNKYSPLEPNKMNHEFLDSRFLFPNYLSSLGEFLIKLSENSCFPVVVRSIEPDNNLAKQKILLHNKASAMFWGLGEEGMEGMPLLDLYERLSLKDKKKHIQRVKETNQEALDRGSKSSTQQQIILDHEGFVHIYRRMVTPVSGKLNNILAVNIISIEITQYANLLALLKLYKSYYQKKSQAIQKISTYLKLDEYFVVPLNCGEVSTLFAMEQVGRQKQIAELLSLSPKTVNNYLDAIKYKLKESMTLFEVLNKLRALRELPLNK